jgi:Xaa-Pro aminopeptidase
MNFYLNLKLFPADDRLEKYKEVSKYADEAVSLTQDLLEDSFRNKKTIREVDLEKAIHEYFSEKGVKESFDTLVASGKRSAEIHGYPTDKIIEPYDPVMLDVGAYNGLCSDITRMFFIGVPSDEFKSAYKLVVEAQEAAISKIDEGIKKDGSIYGARVVSAAKKVMENSKFRKYGWWKFHALGHGIDEEIHSYPLDSKILKPGLVVTIEPAMYIENRWGIRVEDMVLITENGCEYLTKADRQLITIPLL